MVDIGFSHLKVNNLNKKIFPKIFVELWGGERRIIIKIYQQKLKIQLTYLDFTYITGLIHSINNFKL